MLSNINRISQKSYSIPYIILVTILILFGGCSNNSSSIQPKMVSKKIDESQYSNPKDLLGTWVGVYHNYPKYEQIILVLDKINKTSKHTYKIMGEMTSYVLNNYSRNQKHNERKSHIILTYNTNTRTVIFEHKYKKKNKYNSGDIKVLFEGIYERHNKIIAGILPKPTRSSSPFFIMAHNSIHKDVFNKLNKFSKMKLSKSFGLKFFNKFNENDIKNWLSRYDKEFKRTSKDSYKLERILFEDEHFVQFFGSTYDQVNLRAIFDVMIKEKVPKVYLLKKAFSSSGYGGYPDVYVSVLSMRYIRLWYKSMKNRLNQIEADANTLNSIDEISKELDKYKLALWPSERLKVKENIKQAKLQIARPTLIAIIDKLIKRPATYENALKLRNVQSTYSNLFKLVDKQTKTELKDKTQKRKNEIIALLMQEEMKKVNSMSNSINELESSARWYGQFNKRYLSLFSSPEIDKVLAMFNKRRSNQIESTKDIVQAKIAHANTFGEIDRILNRYYSTPIDLTSSIGKSISKSVNNRKRQINLQKYRQNFSKREQNLMNSNGKVAVQNNYSQPTQEEIELAFVREMKNSGFTVIDKKRFKFGAPIPFVSLFTMIAEVQVISRPKCKKKLNTYQCQYRYRFDMELPETIKKDKDKIIKGFFKLIAMSFSKPLTRTDNFQLTQNGWQSATLRKQGRNMMLSSVTGVINGANSGLSKLFSVE